MAIEELSSGALLAQMKAMSLESLQRELATNEIKEQHARVKQAIDWKSEQISQEGRDGVKKAQDTFNVRA